MLIRPYRPADAGEISGLQQSSESDLPAAVPDDFYSDLQAIEATYAGGAFLVADRVGARGETSNS